MREAESRSNWVFGLSLVQMVLLLFFVVAILYVTDRGEVGGQEPQAVSDRNAAQDPGIQAGLHAATAKNAELQRQVGEMASFLDEVKVMVGARYASKEGFQEAVDTLKRGYALCQKDQNTLIEARIHHGAETIQVIGEIPPDLSVALAKGEETSDLEQIVSFIQDVYEYEKDHKCRFNYRLKYGTDNDYRKGRDGYEKYFYPEKLLKIG